MSVLSKDEEGQLPTAIWEERLLAEVVVKRLRESPCPVIVLSPHDIAPHLNGPAGERYWPLLLLAILNDAKNLPSVLSRIRSHYVGPIHIWGLSADVLSLEIHITSSMLPLVISGESDADDGNLLSLVPESTLNGLPLAQLLSNLHSSASSSMDFKMMRVNVNSLGTTEMEALQPSHSWFFTAETAEKKRRGDFAGAATPSVLTTCPSQKAGESRKQYRARMQREEVAKGLHAHFNARMVMQRAVDDFWADQERCKRLVRGHHPQMGVDVGRDSFASADHGHGRSRTSDDEDEDDDAGSSQTGTLSDNCSSSGQSTRTDATSIQEADDYVDEEDKLLVGAMDQLLSPRSTTTDLVAVAPPKRRCSSVLLLPEQMQPKAARAAFIEEEKLCAATDDLETKSIMSTSTSTCKAGPLTPVDETYDGDIFNTSIVSSTSTSSRIGGSPGSSPQKEKRLNRFNGIVGDLKAKFTPRLGHKMQGFVMGTQ